MEPGSSKIQSAAPLCGVWCYLSGSLKMQIGEGLELNLIHSRHPMIYWMNEQMSAHYNSCSEGTTYNYISLLPTSNLTWIANK